MVTLPSSGFPHALRVGAGRMRETGDAFREDVYR